MKFQFWIMLYYIFVEISQTRYNMASVRFVFFLQKNAIIEIKDARGRYRHGITKYQKDIS